MLTCKVKPDYNTCFSCVDDQIIYNKHFDCTACELTSRRCEIVKLGISLFGKPYAMVLQNGTIKKVPLNRVFDVWKEPIERSVN